MHSTRDCQLNPGKPVPYTIQLELRFTDNTRVVLTSRSALLIHVRTVL